MIKYVLVYNVNKKHKIILKKCLWLCTIYYSTLTLINNNNSNNHYNQVHFI